MDHILPITLEPAVNLEMMELALRGGPHDGDFVQLKGFATVLALEGDVLLYGGKKGRAAELYAKLAYCIAVMSYLPGGVKVFGVRYESAPLDDEETVELVTTAVKQLAFDFIEKEYDNYE